MKDQYRRFAEYRRAERNQRPARRLLVVAANMSQIEAWRAAHKVPREEVVPVTSYAEARNEGRKYQPYTHAYSVELPGAYELRAEERLRIMHHLYALGIMAERHP